MRLEGDLAYMQTGANAGKAIYDIYLRSNYTKTLPIGQKLTVGMACLTLWRRLSV